MSNANAKSISLPSAMLEALNDYRSALKDTKAEIKELERDAKRAEKAGLGVDSQAQARRLMLGARANRLEDIVKRQRADSTAAREAINSSILGRRGIVGQVGGMALQRANMVRESLISASGSLRAKGMGRAADVLGRAAGAAGRGTEALTQAMASKGFAAAAGAASIFAATAYIAKKGADVYKDMLVKRREGAAGQARVADTINAFAISAAHGTSSQAISNYYNAVRTAEATGQRVGATASLTDRFMAITNSGYTQTANELSTKLAEVAAARQANILRYGAAYEQATALDEVQRRRSAQIMDARKKNYGFVSNSVSAALRYAGIIEKDDVITGADALSKLLGTYSPAAMLVKWAYSGEEEAEMLATEAGFVDAEGKKWIDERSSLANAWNTQTQYALQRARAHARNSATQAYQEDMMTRALTWRMQ